jgi:general secretion pathway protein I
MSLASLPQVSVRAALRRRQASAGFTLLEVLVAVAILGLGLTVILSSQAGLFSSASRGEHLTVATNLLRCKMSEIELELEQKGFSLTDENDEGPCCGDDEGEGFSCAWKIERVELPPLPDSSLDADGGTGESGSGEPAGMGALSALSKLGAPGATADGQSPAAAAGAVMEQLSSANSSGLEGLVMGLVYPSLKPMLEASIRRVTLKVTWREGVRPRELEVTQFLTRPQEGQLGTADQLGIGGTSAGGLLNGNGTGSGTGGSTGQGPKGGGLLR